MQLLAPQLQRSMINQRPHFCTGTQFSIRTLLILMSILGPLSGWYGPSLVSQLREFMASDASQTKPNAPIARPLRPFVMSKSTAELWAAREEARLQRRIRSLQFHADRENAKWQRENRLSLENQRYNPRVNRDGTFNMRFHEALYKRRDSQQ